MSYSGSSGTRDHALQGWQCAAEELGATSGARDRNVQMDASGRFIPIDQRRYLLEGTRNNHIVDVPPGKQAVCRECYCKETTRLFFCSVT